MDGLLARKPLLQICFRQGRSHLLRTFLLVFGIAMGVAGVVAIDIAKTSVSKSFDLSFSAITSRTTHQITGSSFKIPQSIFVDLRIRLGIYSSAPVITEHVTVKELGNKTLTLTGIDPFSESHFRNLTLDRQGSPEAKHDENKDISGLLTQKTGVLISRADARSYNIKPNDSITLLFGEKEVKTRVAGFLDSQDKKANQVFQGMMVTDISFAQEILGLGDQISRIDLILDDPSQQDQVRAILPAHSVLVETSQQNKAVRQMSQAFETSLTAFSMLALFMGIFLIYNTVSFSVTQRHKINGTLRALGATQGEIFKTTLLEVMIYAIVGSVLGICLGIFLGHFAVKAVCSTVSDMYFVLTVSQVHLSGMTLLKGILAGLISSFAAAVFPAWSASLTEPVTLMRRSAAESAIRKYTPVLTLSGILIVGTTATGLARYDIHPGYDFLAVFMIFFGYSLLSPFFILVSINRLQQVFRSVSGTLTRMAMGNIVRSLSRTSVLIASLMVVTSVYIGIGIMTHSFRVALIEWVDGNIGGDIHVESKNELNRSLAPDLLEKVQQLEPVKAVSAYNIHRIFSQSSGEVHVFSYMKDLSVKRWSWTAVPEDQLNGLLENGWILVSEIFAQTNQISPETGVSVVIETQKGPISFKVAGIFRDFFMGGGRVIVSRDVMKTYFGYTDITAMQIFLQPDQPVEPIMETIRSFIPQTDLIRVRSGKRIKLSILEVFDRTFVITSALQILTAIVALTGILNSVMALLLERTRELGILRACGAEKKQLGQLLISECGLAGFLSGVLALPLGGYLSWVLIAIVNQRSFGWTYDLVISFPVFIQAVCLSFFAAIAAGIFPAVRAAKIDIGQALRME